MKLKTRLLNRVNPRIRVDNHEWNTIFIRYFLLVCMYMSRCGETYISLYVKKNVYVLTNLLELSLNLKIQSFRIFFNKIKFLINISFIYPSHYNVFILNYYYYFFKITKVNKKNENNIFISCVIKS